MFDFLFIIQNLTVKIKNYFKKYLNFSESLALTGQLWAGIGALATFAKPRLGFPLNTCMSIYAREGTWLSRLWCKYILNSGESQAEEDGMQDALIKKKD